MSRYRKAVSLEYKDNQETAPTVTAKGSDVQADYLVRIARRYGVSVVEDGALAQSLDLLPLDHSIPEELYRAVAVVLNRLR